MKFDCISITQKPDSGQCSGSRLTVQDQKKARMPKSRIKTMLIIYFDVKGIVRDEYIPPDYTMNQKYYIELLSESPKRIKKKKRDWSYRRMVGFCTRTMPQQTVYLFSNFWPKNKLLYSVMPLIHWLSLHATLSSFRR
jgi:hypothetical protein